MTIAASLFFSDGLLMCADTQMSSSAKTHATKISYCSLDGGSGIELRTMTAYSGSVPLSGQAVRECESALLNLPQGKRTIAEVRQVLSDTLHTFHHKHIFSHPLYGTDRGPIVQLLCGVWTQSYPYLSLLWSEEDAVADVVDYKCVGSGSYIGDYVASFLYRKSTHTLQEIVLLSTHILRHAKAYDLYCGGQSDFGVIRKDGSWSPPGYFDISSAEAYSERFDDMLREVFFQSADLSIDDDKVISGLQVAQFMVKDIREQQRRQKAQRDGLVKELSKSRK